MPTDENPTGINTTGIIPDAMTRLDGAQLKLAGQHYELHRINALREALALDQTRFDFTAQNPKAIFSDNQRKVLADKYFTALEAL